MIEQLGNDLIPVLAIALSFAFGMFWLLCATIDSLYKTARNARLKEILIDRGSSADEIERIVGAGTENIASENRPMPPVKTARTVHG